LVDQLAHLGGIDLLDLALDLAQKLRSGRAHRQTPKQRSGLMDFTKYSVVFAASATHRAPSARTTSGPARRSGDEQVGEAHGTWTGGARAFVGGLRAPA